MKMKSVLFPVFGSFPNVLNFSNSSKTKSSISSESILFIFDKTGSMGGHLNEKKISSKMKTAKDLILKTIQLNPGCKYDILPFNDKTYDLCKLEDLGEPEKNTFFSPIVPSLEAILKNNKYDSIILMSDGLPTESKDIAYNSIQMMGNITRENEANPVAVAIGVYADGEACSLFAGSRGYNCFIRNESDIDDVAGDINHGINCVYEILPNGLYIPVEIDGNYYYVESNDGSIDQKNELVKPDRKLVEKYLNLVIMKYLSDMSQFPLLKSLVKHSVLLLENENDRNEIIKKYDEVLKTVDHTYEDNFNTPGLRSAVANAFRGTTRQV